MNKFPFVPMEVVERSQYDGGTYFLIQTVSERNGWEVAEVRPDIPWQLKTAQLLAAAPELLASLDEFIAWVDAPCESALSDSQLDKARAAIAKAKGESK